MRTRIDRPKKEDSPLTFPLTNSPAGNGHTEKPVFSPGNKLSDLVPSLILVVDQAGSLVYANAACPGILQFSPEELSGRAFMELVAEKDRRKTAEAIMQSMAEVQSVSLENRCYRKDLSLVHIKWSLHWDDAENMLYCFGEDISERLVQEELASMEKEIIHLNMQPGVTVKQVTHTLLEKTEKLYPGTVCSILRLHPDNTLWNYAAPSLSREYRDLIDGFRPGPCVGSCGTAVHCDRVVIVSDIQNDPLWKDYKDVAARFGLKACWSVPIHDSKGKILGTFGIYHCTIKTPTELMLRTIERLASLIGLLIENSEIVEDLRLSYERHELAAQATHDMIWDWDLQKSQIFRSEEGLKNIYGLSTNDPIRNIDNWVERIHPEDRNRVKRAIEAIYYGRTDTVFQTEYRFLRGDGEYVHIYDRGYIMRDQQGEPVRVIGAAQDITERVMLQDQLSEERNARQEEIMKTTIGVQEKERNEIGNELHDNVNQILTSAKLYIECVGLYDDEKESYRKTGVELIVTAIEEIRRLSRSLVPPRLKDVGLIKSIEDILDNMNVTSGIGVDLCLEDFDEARLEHGLKLALYRIIQEQTTNILKHAAASQVKVQFTQKTNFLVVKITDDGKGFDLAHLTKGIGFTNIINRSAVYHGRVKIESSPGKGCSLTIAFGPSGRA